MNSNKVLIFAVVLSLYLVCSIAAISFGAYSQMAEARPEQFIDTNNNLQVGIIAPDNWNSGTASATVHNLNWRAYSLAATNDDLSAFFVIVSLPSLANIVIPFGQTTGLTSALLSQYVTVNNQHDISFSDGSSGHAYSISITADQLNRLQSFLPSINKQYDAVLITTQHQGGTYVIVFATELGRMGDFIGTFQNILGTVRFGSATYTGGS